MSFIYVFSKDDRDKLLRKGYQLFKSHQGKEVFVFLEKENMEFEDESIPLVKSNILTF